MDTPNNLPWYKKQKPEQSVRAGDVYGSRPKVYKLKDDNTLDGKTITIVNVQASEGEFGVFVILGAFMDDEAITVVTGATDIIERVLPLVESINSGAAIEGKLSKVGRKWFFD